MSPDCKQRRQLTTDFGCKFTHLPRLFNVYYVITRRLRVIGFVQGVGYRDALRAEAERQGVSGWVRNRRDGNVEALLQGPADRVEAVIAWSRAGPPAARVLDVQVDTPPAAETSLHERFERWPTV